MTSPTTLPFISVIVAVYNGVKTLQQCIDSVAQQLYPNVELIIIDGASTDGTVDLLEKNNEYICHWCSEPDTGIYNAWNKGLGLASGEWICFLGADDFFWDDYVLKRMVEFLVQLPTERNVAYGQIMFLTKNGEPLGPIGEPWAQTKDRFQCVMAIPHQGVMHRRALFERHGRFDESFLIAGDYELLLRELKSEDAAYVPLMVAGMRHGGISSNQANILQSLREFRRAQGMHIQRVTHLFWLRAFIKEHIRLTLWRVFGQAAAKMMLDIGRRFNRKPAIWTRL